MTTREQHHNASRERKDSATGAEPVFVSAPIGEGADAHRIVKVGEWEFTAPGVAGDDLLMPDEVLGARLGLAEKDVRALVRRHAEGGNIRPILNLRTVRRFTRDGRSRGSVVVEGFLLNEEDALFVTAHAETPKAVALTKEMISVYVRAHRGLMAPAGMDTLQRTVAELRGEVGRLQADLATGVIGAEVAERAIAEPLREIAILRARGSARSYKSTKAGLSTRLHNLLGFVGSGSKWSQLPRRCLAQAQRQLEDWRRQEFAGLSAEERRRRAEETRRRDEAKARQGSISFGPKGGDA